MRSYDVHVLFCGPIKLLNSNFPNVSPNRKRKLQVPFLPFSGILPLNVSPSPTALLSPQLPTQQANAPAPHPLPPSVRIAFAATPRSSALLPFPRFPPLSPRLLPRPLLYPKIAHARFNGAGAGLSYPRAVLSRVRQSADHDGGEGLGGEQAGRGRGRGRGGRGDITARASGGASVSCCCCCLCRLVGCGRSRRPVVVVVVVVHCFLISSIPCPFSLPPYIPPCRLSPTWY